MMDISSQSPKDIISGNRGPKHKWLMENRPMILWYLSLFGDEATKSQFHLTDDTLYRLKRYPDKPQGFVLAKPDKALAMAEIAIEGQRELKAKIRILESAFSKFTEIVGTELGIRIGDLIAEWLRIRLPIDHSLDSERDTSLDIEELIRQAENVRIKLPGGIKGKR